MGFKTCTGCGTAWTDRDAFLSDPDLILRGYQANFSHLEAGFFLFNHMDGVCGSTLSLPVGYFSDLFDGPIFQSIKAVPPECEGYCLRDGALDPCAAKCECAYVREVIQIILHWPKRAA